MILMLATGYVVDRFFLLAGIPGRRADAYFGARGAIRADSKNRTDRGLKTA